MTTASLVGEIVGTGQSVLFLHAFPYSRAMWAQQRVLADQFRLLLPDLPGFGQNPVPLGGWTLDLAADMTANWLDSIQAAEPVAVVGLSMGGYLAIALARRHPARLRALVLADTRAEPDSDEARAGRDKSAALVRSQGVAALVADALPKQLSQQTRAHRPTVLATAQQIAEAQSVEGVASALVALRDRPDARPGLATITVPTLVIVGADDTITPPSAAQVLVEGIPGATLTTLPTAGHLSNMETPVEFNAAVREFLSRL